MIPLKSFGQIFLKDNRYIEKMLNNMSIEDEFVLEIGSGDGKITSFLLEKAKFVYALEFDNRFVEILKKRFRDFKNIEVIKGDILKFRIDKLNKKIVVFGNIPYHLSSKIIEYLILYREYIKIAYLTFQKEFSDRLLANVSTKSYSALTCFLNYYGIVKKILDIPSSAFSPRPKVDSTFLKIEFYKDLPYKAKNEDFLFNMIRKTFLNRRKKIINSIPILKEKKELLKELNLDEYKRSEDLSIKDYVYLANKLLN